MRMKWRVVSGEVFLYIGGQWRSSSYTEGHWRTVALQWWPVEEGVLLHWWSVEKLLLH
ncbi:unnamed protein product [Staurois parvus]|uniref:Uncharacterized protein n=1 Tax=Staurois parvus TaxID=386267 RepID=A0ABN9AAU1_9NEOB|nr:unnamed protein product [Staurois parvus]